ncbi:MAG TPA: hypothetical protein VFV22_00760 [Candidatus Paceibacterota bacterium]|nr:hypothetical protein [Candidatus Paceibacterota bacterium]
MGRARRRRRRNSKRTYRQRLLTAYQRVRLRYTYPRLLTTEKEIGETPLEATERLRSKHNLPKSLPLAYAGRLDPMASGKLLILVGETCKKQKKFHTLDKEYVVELLLGIGSDTGDVLGELQAGKQIIVSSHDVERVLHSFVGRIHLPYPIFSSKTVQGKPLHTWALEGMAHTIEIPIKESRIYKLQLNTIALLRKETLCEMARAKIETIPVVTDTKKKLGADFRRSIVRENWDTIAESGLPQYQVITFTCIASSGTYMRTLCSHIAEKLGTHGLALSIHRTKMGRYMPLTKKIGFWRKTY